MATRTSTRTSTVLSSRRIQQESQENPKPFNKRPAKSHNDQATPAKARKLSRSDTAARRIAVEIPAKTLASALKRRQESMSLGSESSLPRWPCSAAEADNLRRRCRTRRCSACQKVTTGKSAVFGARADAGQSSFSCRPDPRKHSNLGRHCANGGADTERHEWWWRQEKQQRPTAED